MPKTNENNILVRNMESVGGDKLLCFWQETILFERLIPTTQPIA